MTPVGALPPVYGWLAEHGAGRPLLELPVRSWRGDVVGNLREQRYAWASIRHWLPHLSGRSGYFPPSYDLILPMARRLPDPAALDALVSLTGLHWIVVHGDDMRWDDRPMEGLELASTFGSDRVYRVNRGPSADWQAELVRRLRGSGESATFAGTPLRPLPSRDLRADFTRVDLPQRSPPRLAVPATITVRNRGRRTCRRVRRSASTRWSPSRRRRAAIGWSSAPCRAEGSADVQCASSRWWEIERRSWRERAGDEGPQRRARTSIVRVSGGAAAAGNGSRGPCCKASVSL